MFDPKVFGFEKWNVGERYNLFVVKNKIISFLCNDFRGLLSIGRDYKDCKIYHLTQKDNKTWIIELITRDRDDFLYQGFIPSNSFAFELFDNFEYKIPNLYSLDI